jgi:hypothetical protein
MKNLMPLVCSALLIYATPALKAQQPEFSPKAFVQFTEGERGDLLKQSDRVIALKEGQVINPQGATIKTDEKSTVSLLLSNSTGLNIGSSTTVQVESFKQNYFEANRKDLDIEPSVSSSSLLLKSGVLGICRPTPYTGSTMHVKTSLGGLTVRGRRVLVAATDTGMLVWPVEGDATYTAKEVGGRSLIIETGKVLELQRNDAQTDMYGIPGEFKALEGTGNKYRFVDPKSLPGKVQDAVALACMARKRVVFEVNEENELEPLKLYPVNPEEVGPVVSPYRIISRPVSKTFP